MLLLISYFLPELFLRSSLQRNEIKRQRKMMKTNKKDKSNKRKKKIDDLCQATCCYQQQKWKKIKDFRLLRNPPQLNCFYCRNVVRPTAVFFADFFQLRWFSHFPHHHKKKPKYCNKTLL